MEFFDLKKQYHSIRPEIKKIVDKVFNSGQFILGQEVEKFENKIAQYLGVSYAVGVASGTDALLLSLIASNIKKDDEVITTAFSFIATANTIVRLGAKPVFVDIDPKTFNIDVSQIEQKITKKTKAIIPVHLYGQIAEMDKIMHLARQYQLFVIEDACQAIDAKYKNKKAGSIGHFGCFSFFPTKNLSAYGDGGLISTNNKNWAEAIKILRNHGAKEKYYHQVIGLNSRLDELQAAILSVKLQHLNQWNQQRKNKAEIYNQTLHQYITIPYLSPKCQHIYHQYTIRTSQRDRLQNYLIKNNIQTIVYYPRPLHLQPCFKYFGYHKGDFPEAEKASQEVLSLPMYPELPEQKQNYIIEKIKKLKNNTPDSKLLIKPA